MLKFLTFHFIGAVCIVAYSFYCGEIKRVATKPKSYYDDHAGPAIYIFAILLTWELFLTVLCIGKGIEELDELIKKHYKND